MCSYPTVPSLETGPRVEEASRRSVRWLDRCIDFHEKSGRQRTQNLFAIVQGGLDPELRAQCLEEMVRRKDRVAGYAVGGLSGGEEKGALSFHRSFSATDLAKRFSGECRAYLLSICQRSH